MPDLGSSVNPTWNGWWNPGHGYAFAAPYTSPNVDIAIDSIAAYFETDGTSNGAIGWLCIWAQASPSPVLFSHSVGIINVGRTTYGGQVWQSYINIIPRWLLAANTPIWIGGYSDQGLIFSTYDTSPQTFMVKMGGVGQGPGNLTPGIATGQGPCGGYVGYTTIIKASQFYMGGSGDLSPRVDVIKYGSPGILGSGPDGIKPVNSVILTNLTSRMGGSGGLDITGEVVNRPKIRIWR